MWVAHLLIFSVRCRWSVAVLLESRFAWSPLWPTTGSHHPGLLASYCSQRVRSPDMNFWNQCLALRSLTALSSKAWWRNTAAERPKLNHKGDSTEQDSLTPLCFLCSDRYACTTDMHWSRTKQTPSPPPHYRHVTVIHLHTT